MHTTVLFFIHNAFFVGIGRKLGDGGANIDMCLPDAGRREKDSLGRTLTLKSYLLVKHTASVHMSLIAVHRVGMPNFNGDMTKCILPCVWRTLNIHAPYHSRDRLECL